MAKKPGVSAAKGKGTGKNKRVSTSGGGQSYSNKSGIVRETSTKKPTRGAHSK